MISGVKLLEERAGAGAPAAQGDTVEFESRAFLSGGDVAQDRLVMSICLGKREVIAGVENSLIGMKPGGYRKVKISPHLAYRDAGVPDCIPPNAVLVYELWMRKVSGWQSRKH